MEIDLKRISKKYNDDVILKSINLSFKSGEVYFIVGESGCGKSTLLKIIGGLILDYKGEVLFDNKNIKDIDESYLRNELVTYIDQYSYLLDYLSINENIDMIINKQIKRKYHKKYKFYSGGEKRRIATYVSSLKRSKIILADEISSSLDKDNALKVMKYLRKIAKNKILIVVSHDLFLINDSDHVINLEKRQNKLNLSHKVFKYTNRHHQENYFKLAKYSLIKALSNKKYVFSFVSSFMIGLVLILLVSSLKTGIISFLDNEVLNEFNYNYLLLENDDNFYYGDEDKFSELSNETLILLDDFYFDETKNEICMFNNEKLLYFQRKNNFAVSSAFFKENNYSYLFNINGYELYINDVFDSNELIIRCPFSFFKDYYEFKQYKLSDYKSKNMILYIEDNDKAIEIYHYINKEFNDIKVNNLGIEAYLYIDSLLAKIEILLSIFIVVSLLITFFLILTIIRLDIEDEKDEIRYLKVSGKSNLYIFVFYYLTNLYRGLITFIITFFFYVVVIKFSNVILMKQLGLKGEILFITPSSIMEIILLIPLIITFSVLFNAKELKLYKK